MDPEEGYYSANASMASLEDRKETHDEAAPMDQPGPSTFMLADVGDQSDTTGDRDESDSAYDSASLLGDDTRSLASYITDYRYEHGRRYHAYRDGAYWVSWIVHCCASIEFGSQSLGT